MITFLDDLQRQLVAASRSLSRAQPAATSGSPRWSRSLRRSSVVLIGVLVVTGTAVAATTQLIGDRDESLRVIERLATTPEGADHRYVRANGLDPADANLLFVTPDGLEVSAVRDSEATCIMISDGDEQCYRATAMRSGLGFSIGNDCSAASERHMRVAGTAPAGTQRLHLAYSSGPGRTANVINGIFVIDTTTPTRGESYPVALEARDGDGDTLARSEIPNARNLCMERSGS